MGLEDPKERLSSLCSIVISIEIIQVKGPDGAGGLLAGRWAYNYALCLINF